MAPALALRRALARNALASSKSQVIKNNNPASICLLCSFSTAAAARRSSPISLPRPQLGTTAINAILSNIPRRFQSTDRPEDPFSYNGLSQTKLRSELSARLQELQSQFPNLVEPARLKLALRSLSEPPGLECVRVAILAPVDPEAKSSSDATVKQLVRATLADELSAEAEWEKQLEEHDLQHNPLVIRVQPSTGEGISSVGGKKDGAIPEIVATSPTLGRLGLELLLSRVDTKELEGAKSVEDALLVPKVHRHGPKEIDLDSARETSDVATPVHYTLLVSNGLRGAVSALELARATKGSGMVELAVDFKTALAEEDLGGVGQKLPFISLNVDAANRGLDAMRQGNVDLFMDKWLEGNASRIRDWLKEKSVQDAEGKSPDRTRPAITALIKSLLEKAGTQVRQKESSSQFVAGSDVERLQKSLEDWAQSAHEELQQQLTMVSTKRSWRKLSWWKLFWRADDVGRLTSDMVAEHFLPEAEKSIIHLAGRIDETVIKAGKGAHQPAYEGPANSAGKWPTQIPYTRNLIQEHTVPHLQALAQKLVIRSAGISGLSAGLAGFSYFYSAGAYECGAIAALGVILSFRQIQARWEKAQRYWETEVREEGRRAIKATENSINGMLNWASEGQVVETRKRQEEEAERARQIIERAQEALKRL